MSQPSLFGTPPLASAVANVDGGSRGNPGPAGYGVRIERPDGTIETQEAELSASFGDYFGSFDGTTWSGAWGEPDHNRTWYVTRP